MRTAFFKGRSHSGNPDSEPYAAYGECQMLRQLEIASFRILALLGSFSKRWKTELIVHELERTGDTTASKPIDIEGSNMLDRVYVR